MYSNADAKVPVEVESNVEKYSVQAGVNRLPDIADVPYLDIVAAKNDSGTRLTLFCVNRHLTRDMKTRIDLGGFRASRSATVQTLAAESIYQANDEMEPEAVVPVRKTVAVQPDGFVHTFPAASVTVIEFRNDLNAPRRLLANGLNCDFVALLGRFRLLEPARFDLRLVGAAAQAVQ